MAGRRSDEGGVSRDEESICPFVPLLEDEKAALRRLVTVLLEKEHAAQVGQSASERHARRLPVRTARGATLFVRVEQIDWIEATDQYVRLHTGEKSHLMRVSMAQMEAWLDPRIFRRIHRSALVNLDRVQELYADSSHRWVVLDNGSRLRVSESQWEGLNQALMGLD